MKKILIIGGSRFIGPPLIDEFVKSGDEVAVFNRGLIQSEYARGVRFIQGDRDQGFGISEHFDVVVDTCAYRGEQTKRAIEELRFDFFLHMSTAAVYKKTEIFPLTEESPIGEWPLWGDYNKGKVECERVLAASKIKFAVIRPVYILGPNNYCDRERFIYSKIKRGDPIILPGSGKALIQFVFAKDVARSIALIAEKKIAGAFNCAGDEVITLRGLVEEMGRIMRFEPKLRYNPEADSDKFDISEFPFANAHLLCDNAKLKNMGVVFTSLQKDLREDYESYYRHVI
ncbi:MAG: hypothetical protein A2925_01270 [Candidatus Yanofskybacteria bacterium RIFCSPLOWO2_01_FULL_44_22]|uniref:NAD-dependent epimerase/dehydratase domain-containing protein n=1 Tax=Candidatus Yanofskybacteria bacterium RIFCSPLOWO2_01_FULL_44_22 TaxID=1802697 RepID=A0A1F8GN49_9BACT|nr:MAG: hypothetical protein A2925_01270 [Candidatus Yanofskybacteria bacterium RIFCSPLOWO2_01_FULL_44_22]